MKNITDIYDRKARNIKIALKAIQNIKAAEDGFNTLCQQTKTDLLVGSSIFYWSIIRYSKPFLDSKMGSKTYKYPIKEIKKTNGFDESLHNHIIDIRNKLIAHDDFTEVDPRILWIGINIEESNKTIYKFARASNKCISYPSDKSTILRMFNQSKILGSAIFSKFQSDLNELKVLHERHCDDLREYFKFSKKSDPFKTEPGLNVLMGPGALGAKWLDIKTPSHPEIINGYVYEALNIECEFDAGKIIELE